MKTKILLLLLFTISIGMAQQKKIKNKEAASKDFIELQKYPVPLTPIQPVYPEAAKLGGVQGKVYVETMIDEEGNAVETKILKSEQEALNNAAMDAIKKTKFSPGVSKQNKVVKAKVVIPINFKLDEKAQSPDLGKSVNAPGDLSDPDINAMIKVEKMPAMIEAGKPVYPEEAKKNNITGKTFVKVLIDKEGNPKRAVVIKSDNEIFNQSAADAAMKSKFSPALQEGKPVAVWVVLPYKFALDQNEMDSNSFENLEKAKEYFQGYIHGLESSNSRNEKLSNVLSYGDESALYRISGDKYDKYSFITRKGADVLSVTMNTLEDLKKVVNKKLDEAFKKLESKRTKGK